MRYLLSNCFKELLLKYGDDLRHGRDTGTDYRISADNGVAVHRPLALSRMLQ